MNCTPRRQRQACMQACLFLDLHFSHSESLHLITDDVAAVFDVAAERGGVPAGARRLPPLPRATPPHQAHALPQRRATTDLQVSQDERAIQGWAEKVVCIGFSQRRRAKFGEGSSIRADWLCIGCPKLVGRRKAGYSTRGHFFCMSL